MLNFEELLLLAKQGDIKSKEQVLEMYKPLLVKNALVNGRFDEDLYMELVAELFLCIKRFKS